MRVMRPGQSCIYKYHQIYKGINIIYYVLQFICLKKKRFERGKRMRQ